MTPCNALHWINILAQSHTCSGITPWLGMRNCTQSGPEAILSSALEPSEGVEGRPQSNAGLLFALVDSRSPAHAELVKAILEKDMFFQEDSQDCCRTA